MAKQKFFRRKLWQLGNIFGLDLINAADPGELFSILLRCRGNEANKGLEGIAQEFCTWAIA